MNAAKLIRASFYLKNPQCLFIAGATDKYLPITNEIKIFGKYFFVIDNLQCHLNELEPLASYIIKYIALL